MLKINIRNFTLDTAFNCMFFSIICKMMYPVNQNSALRLLGYGFQIIIILCYLAQELIWIKKNTFNGLAVGLSLLVVFQCLIAIMTKSVYWPYAPIDILIWPLSIIVYYNFSN